MTESELRACLEEGKANAGAAGAQIDHFIAEVDAYAGTVEGSKTYQPGSIL
jgi:hypothetical protein